MRADRPVLWRASSNARAIASRSVTSQDRFTVAISAVAKRSIRRPSSEILPLSGVIAARAIPCRRRDQRVPTPKPFVPAYFPLLFAEHWRTHSIVEGGISREIDHEYRPRCLRANKPLEIVELDLKARAQRVLIEIRRPLCPPTPIR